MNDFVPEAPEVNGELPTPSTDPSITPPSQTTDPSYQVKAWAECENLLQLYLNGYTYFVSSTRTANGEFQYTLEIKSENQDVEFKGRDANGNAINTTYTLYSGVNKNYNSSSINGGTANFRFGSVNKLDEKIIEFKPHNMQNYIKFALAKKS